MRSTHSSLIERTNRSAYALRLGDRGDRRRVGAPADDIHELFQHTGELLEVMGEEIESKPTEGEAALRSVCRGDGRDWTR
jgi:hypothetical protein